MRSSSRQLAERLIDWHWQEGCKRTDRFALPLSSWLDRLYGVAETLGELEASEKDGKANLALWGPSQTGKSTLLSCYIDKEADKLGNNSALHWPGGSPARFVVADKNANAIVLNPFNYQSDGSSCVSRFVVRDAVADSTHPVEIRLTTEAQIMHSLAMGYFSECQVGDARREDSRFTTDSFRKRSRSVASSLRSGPVNREAYEALRSVVGLIEMLAVSGHERYENLHRDWISLRREILENAQLLAAPEHVWRFAAEIFWDSKPALTALFENFRNVLRRYQREWREQPVFCSLATAAKLLDTQAFQRLQDSAKTPADKTYRDEIFSFGWKTGAGSIQVGPHHAVDAAHSLVRTEEDFGLLQGLILELVIPLRRETLQLKAASLCALLEQADILDFPGVARAYTKDKDVRLDLDALPTSQSQRLFTEVVKRGKTSSIVMKYAQTFRIDGFSILTMWGNFPSQPDQLISGIKAWWRYFDPLYSHEKAGAKKSPLPYNLALTFCSRIVNQVIMNGPGAGLASTFKDQIGQLGLLGDPAVITHTFATNYAQFAKFTNPEQMPLANNDRLVEQARDAIENDPAFNSHFRSAVSKESFKAMIKDGGTDYFLMELKNQAAASPRIGLLADRRAEQLGRLEILIREARPDGSDYADRRKRELLGWKNALANALSSNVTQEADVAGLSLALRQFLHVEAGILKRLPLNLAGGARSRETALSYWEKQFQIWRDDKVRRLARGNAATFGVADEAHLNRLLHYLVEAAPMEELRQWLIENFGHLSSEEKCEINRRFVAIKMTKALLGHSSNGNRAHRAAGEIEAELHRYAEHEAAHPYDYRYSPHYSLFIEPLLKRIEELAERAPAGSRPKQPGDDELSALLALYSEGNGKAAS